MCDLVILEISNMPEATSGCSAALAAAKYYCMKNAAAEALCDFQYCSDETRLFANFDILIQEKV